MNLIASEHCTDICRTFTQPQLIRMKTIEKARFDTRLSKEHKELFEYAAQLGGYRNLTDYVIHVLMEKSTLIIEKHATIISSKKDQEVFFDAITATPEPNQALKNAFIKYTELTNKLNEK